MHTLLCQFSRAAFTLVSAVADEGREAQVSEDWRLWWCPVIKEEWVNEKNLQLSQEAKEVTEMLRKQVFAEHWTEGKEYTIGEFRDENQKEVMPNMKGWGTSYYLEQYHRYSW